MKIGYAQSADARHHLNEQSTRIIPANVEGKTRRTLLPNPGVITHCYCACSVQINYYCTILGACLILAGHQVMIGSNTNNYGVEEWACCNHIRHNIIRASQNFWELGHTNGKEASYPGFPAPELLPRVLGFGLILLLARTCCLCSLFCERHPLLVLFLLITRATILTDTHRTRTQSDKAFNSVYSCSCLVFTPILPSSFH